MSIFKGIFKQRDRRVIIGIHGLDNKPSKTLLYKWWKNSILEGLKKIKGKRKRFRFEMAYWADLMYEKPLDPFVQDSESELYIEEPYIAEPIPTQNTRFGFLHHTKLIFNKAKQAIFLSRNGLANHEVLFDMVVKSSFKDLDAYYNSDCSMEEKLQMRAVKQRVRQRLLKLIRKYRHDHITIIAHSMGSLISYDVLSELPQHYSIDLFISMGSPIGLPVIREKMGRDHGWEIGEDKKLPTPIQIKKWINFSDPGDHFAVFNDLSNHYEPNSEGILPIDVIVDNDYKNWITHNAHKSFGYLRTPEVAEVLAEFLGVRKKNIWQKGKAFLKESGRKLSSIPKRNHHKS